MGNSIYTWEHVRQVAEHPHLLGHLCGMKDLTQIHSDWIHYIHDADDDKALMASRSSYKSSAIVIIGVMYRLMRNKDETICVLRKNYTLAAEVIRAVMGYMETPHIHEFFRFVWFADKHGNIPKDANWKFDVRKEGSLNLSVRSTRSPETTLMAAGIDSNLTGKHFDFLLADDFITIDDRLYQNERNFTRLVMGEIRGNIVKKTGYTAMIGTKWHREDYWGDVEAEGMEILKYPYTMLTDIIKPDELEKARRTQTGPLFSCNYELSYINSEDMLFANPYMGKWNKAHNKRICAHIDAAYGGKDTTALTIAAEMPDGRINIAGFVWHEHIKNLIPRIFAKLQNYSAHTLYAEQNADKGYTLHMLHESPLNKMWPIYDEPYNESMNKQQKIASVLKDKWESLVFAEETDNDYLLQCTDWNEETKYQDDCPDSLASVLLHGGFSMGGDWMALYS